MSDQTADGRTIAIGDIHGCANALETLLGALDLVREDTLIVLGDSIDRGPSSRKVIELLLCVRERCQFVPILGNHEQMLLDAVANRIPLQDWLIHGGSETLDSYGKDAALSELPEEHLEFIRSWGDYYEIENYFFAHGNYHSKLSLECQPWDVMRWRSLKISMPAEHISGKIAIVGHTANKQGNIIDQGHLICIDTYCHGGKWLTALEPATGQVWQANEDAQLCER